MLAVKTSIKQNGFGVISVCDGMAYTVGMCGGEKGGYEFISTGLGGGSAASVFKLLRENLPFVKSMLKQTETQGSDAVVFRNMMQYRNTAGEPCTGPVTVVKVTEKNKKHFCTMHAKYYKHSNFTAWQILICDVEGRAAFEEGYDKELMKEQSPLFQL